MEAKETSVSPFHISLAACGLGAVEGRCLSWLFPVEELGWLRSSCASAGLDSDRRNGFLYPVLKHGPRSLTYVRVQGCQTPVRNESNSGRTFWALSAGLNPSGERSECEHTCWDPKDGELCLNRVKPGETLVEARSDSDVQIDRQIWV